MTAVRFPLPPMNPSSLGFLKTALLVAGVAALSGAAFAQQPPQGIPLGDRFYAALAAAAEKADTKKVGGQGGSDFLDVPKEGGILVGFDVWLSDPSEQHMIVRGIRAVFQTANGRVGGAMHGRENGNPIRVEAKDGYAVAAIEARGSNRLDGLQVLFWKIHPFDVSLDADGAYKSEWIGGEAGKKALHPLSSNGNPVIGISGASGNAVDRVGLVYYDRH